MTPAHMMMAAALVSGVEFEVGSLEGEPTVVTSEAGASGLVKARILGESVRGELLQMTSSQLTVKVGDERRQIATEDIVVISNRDLEPGDAAVGGLHLRLRDGSRLTLTGMTDNARELSLASESLGELKLPRRDARSVRMMPDAGLEKEWNALLLRNVRYDMLVVRKEKKVKEGDTERVVRTLDHLQGIVSGIDEEFVRFQLDGNEVPVKRQNVFGVIYAAPSGSGDEKPARPACQLQIVGGDLIGGESVTSDGEYAFLKLSSGARIELPLTAVASMTFGGDRINYLSDLEPRDVKYTPYFDFVHEYRVDTNQVGQPLGTYNFVFDRGLWIHSKTELTYRINGDYSQFLALAGIEAEMREKGDLELKILGDDRVLFESKVSGQDSYRLLNLDVEGVRELKIIVDFGGQLDIGDHLCLGDAKLVR